VKDARVYGPTTYRRLAKRTISPARRFTLDPAASPGPHQRFERLMRGRGEAAGAAPRRAPPTQLPRQCQRERKVPVAQHQDVHVRAVQTGPGCGSWLVVSMAKLWTHVWSDSTPSVSAREGAGYETRVA
jgi:hypothetical protein